MGWLDEVFLLKKLDERKALKSRDRIVEFFPGIYCLTLCLLVYMIFQYFSMTHERTYPTIGRCLSPPFDYE